MDEKYFAQKIERKWQRYWAENKTFETKADATKPKFYALEMLPYPSGRLHMGHVRNYTIGDALAWYKRLKGFNVLHPIGWDSFGQPAEQAAIKKGVNPRDWTEENIKQMREQLQRLGISYDWSREIAAHRPAYYKFDQWFFLKMLQLGLAYKKVTQVNWCPRDATTLSNEQASGGVCWRCGTPVEKKDIAQWFLRITNYAEELLTGMSEIESGWAERVLTMQKHWIGRSEGAFVEFKVSSQQSAVSGQKPEGGRQEAEGSSERAEVGSLEREDGNLKDLSSDDANVETIRVFTTRIDTIYGANAIVVAAEHPVVAGNYDNFDERVKADIERIKKDKAKPVGYGEEVAKDGTDTDLQAINPFNNERLPVWVGNYVMMEYGTGAVMSVPAHDERDFEFAMLFNLPVRQVVADNPDTNKHLHGQNDDSEAENLNTDRPADETSRFNEQRQGEASEKQPVEEKLKGLVDETKDLEDVTRALKDEQETLENETIVLGDEIQAVEKKLEALENETQALENEIQALENKIQAINFKKEALENEKEAINFQIQAINFKKEALESEKEAINFQIQDIFFKKEGINSKKEGISEKIEALSNRLRALQDGTEALSHNIRAQKSQALPPHDARQAVDNEKNDVNNVRKGIAGETRGIAAESERTSNASIDISRAAAQSNQTPSVTAASTGYGFLINSGEWNGKSSADAKREMTAFAEAHNFGESAVTYRLRDWGISRQRFWGAPIPIIYCEQCGTVPVPVEQLPVELPESAPFTGVGESPLAKVPEFVNTTCPQCGAAAKRETDTMDTFVDSTWYYFRYTDPHNTELPFAPEAAAYWLPVDQYIGGVDHAVMHLLYTRFWTKVMRDIGLIDFGEPVKNLLTQGMVVGESYYSKDKESYVAPDEVIIERNERGKVVSATLKEDKSPVKVAVEKMSKSKYNGVDPDDMIEVYGADAARIFALFAAPAENELVWLETGIEGAVRFLQRVWRFVYRWNDVLEANRSKYDGNPPEIGDEARKLRRKTHQTVERVTENFETFQFNTPVAALMELSNALGDFKVEPHKADAGDIFAVGEAVRALVLMLAPYAPHAAEELWETVTGETGIVASNAAFPVADANLTRADELEIPVQINGKLRARLNVAAETPKDELEAMALADVKVREFTSGREIVKVVVVPNRLVNIVVK